MSYQMTKSEAIHWAMMDKIEARTKESKEELKDVEPTDESELDLKEFIDYQCREYELKNHLEHGSMTFEDILHDKDLLTRKEISLINQGATRWQIKQNRKSEWQAYKKQLAAKKR